MGSCPLREEDRRRSALVPRVDIDSAKSTNNVYHLNVIALRGAGHPRASTHTLDPEVGPTQRELVRGRQPHGQRSSRPPQEGCRPEH
jgi:hypothetical protein